MKILKHGVKYIGTFTVSMYIPMYIQAIVPQLKHLSSLLDLLLVNIPSSQYWSNRSIICVRSSSTSHLTNIGIALVTQSRVTQKRRRDIVEEHTESVDEMPLPPPAKRVSRLKLTFCDAQENIKNIDRRVTRLSKKNKK